DTASIAVMEIVDNAFILLVPVAMAAGLADFLFWWSLAVGLFIAFLAAFPLNRVLIARGRGHAVVHGHPYLLVGAGARCPCLQRVLGSRGWPRSRPAAKAAS